MTKLVLLFTMVSAGVAHAGPADTGVEVIGLAELTPAVMLAVDGVARPTSPSYASVEIGVGGATAALNGIIVLGLMSDHACTGCQAAVPWFMGFALVDVLAAVHGGYVLTHQPTMLAPTVIQAGKTTLPGLALGGSF